MKIESRIVRNETRTISIREAEAIYEDARNDALREYFAVSQLGDSLGFDRNERSDFLSLRGGLLG